MCLSWLSAINNTEEVMKPETTEWDKKLATKPNRKMQNETNIAPDKKASVIAPSTWLIRPALITDEMVDAVIIEAVATWPTASVVL